jgi:hypothetical protein
MEVSTKELPTALMDILYAGLVPMVKSSPGMGKSEIVKQVSDNLNLEMIDIRLSQMDPAELCGYPMIKDGKTDFIPPKVLPIESDPIPKGRDGMLVFFDELNSASLATQSSAYKVILDRMVGQHKLHKNVAIVAAGNKDTDKAITNRLSTAMQSRLVHLNLVVKHKDWLEWANEAKVDSRITSFIEFKPDLLHNFDPNHKDSTYCCPRTWMFANKLIKDKDTINQLTTTILAGTIGEGAAREFKGFTEIYESLPNINSIIANPKEVRYPKTPDVLYALTGLIGSSFSKDNADKLTMFIETLPMEFQIVTFISAIKRNKEVFGYPSVKQWVSKHAKEGLF